jgi:hypothetical protein
MIGVTDMEKLEISSNHQEMVQLAQKWLDWKNDFPVVELDWWLNFQEGDLERSTKIVSKSPNFFVFNQGKTSIEEFFHIELEQHTLRKSRVEFGFNPTETQLNKALCSFLEAGGSEDLSRKRIRSFLKALFYNSTDNTFFDEFDKKDNNIWVDSEFSVSGKKKNRIDLAIGWSVESEKNSQYLVVIENKFKHRVTTGQLSAYRIFAKNKCQNSDNIFLFLVSPEGSPPESKRSRGYPPWIGRSWLNLLRGWDQSIDEYTEIDNQDFLRFRRILWDKLT